MPDQRPPYGAFNFVVKFDGDEIFGGFQEVSGLNNEMVMSEYRTGNEPINHVRKVPGLHKVGDVTLKRGVVNSRSLWQWIGDLRVNGYSSKKNVTVTLRAEDASDVQSWVLRSVAPMKYTGPTLNAKQSTDVAMEELVLSCEGIDIE